MKVSFWRFKSALIVATLFMPVIFLPLIIVGIVFAKEIFGIALIVVGLIGILSFLSIIFFDKKYLSKIIFSNNGFEIIRFKKQVIYYDWSDITEIKTTPCGKAGVYLTFMIGNNQIDIDLNKKIYNAIMILCPYTGIKTMINNLERFKYLHRDKK